MSHRTLLSSLLLLALMLSVAACSSGPKPEEVAKAAFEATVSADMATAKPLYCPAMREQFPTQEEMDTLQQELDVKFKFDFTGLTYKLVKEEEDRAVVQVSGTLVVKLPGSQEELQYNESIPLLHLDDQWLVCEE